MHPTIDHPCDFPQNWANVKFAKPEYTKSRIDAAGATLVREGLWSIEREIALRVINNWRSSHSCPLQVFYNTLRRRALDVNAAAIVAQRIKRLPSIQDKLTRFPGMLLSRMQDIGGCRAVLHSVDEVDQLVKVYKGGITKNPRHRQTFVNEKDYIRTPKDDGYRCYHMVFKYNTDSPERKVYNGLRIEIQLRSRLQHIWATAVETTSTFTGQALKSNVGSEDWKRFFALMASEMAVRESCPIVAGTPENAQERVDEIGFLAAHLQVGLVLQSWGIAVNFVAEDPAFAAGAYLLQLDPHRQQLTITPYRKSQLLEADEAYLQVEKQYEDSDRQAVLVSVDSLATLRSSYPNYYLDTTEFLGILSDITGIPYAQVGPPYSQDQPTSVS